MQDTRLILDGKNQRRLVVARRLGVVAPDDQETRDVVALILDAFGDHAEIVNFFGEAAGDRRELSVLSGHRRSVSCAPDLFNPDVGKMGGKPTTTLGQRLRMGNDPLNFLSPTAA